MRPCQPFLCDHVGGANHPARMPNSGGPVRRSSGSTRQERSRTRGWAGGMASKARTSARTSRRRRGGGSATRAVRRPSTSGTGSPARPLRRRSGQGTRVGDEAEKHHDSVVPVTISNELVSRETRRRVSGGSTSVFQDTRPRPKHRNATRQGLGTDGAERRRRASDVWTSCGYCAGPRSFGVGLVARVVRRPLANGRARPTFDANPCKGTGCAESWRGAR